MGRRTSRRDDFRFGDETRRRPRRVEANGWFSNQMRGMDEGQRTRIDASQLREVDVRSCAREGQRRVFIANERNELTRPSSSHESPLSSTLPSPFARRSSDQELGNPARDAELLNEEKGRKTHPVVLAQVCSGILEVCHSFRLAPLVRPISRISTAADVGAGLA